MSVLAKSKPNNTSFAADWRMLVLRRTKDYSTRLLNWEKWPRDVFYLCLSPVWIWQCIKSRSIWFFTAANPTLTFGGFEGESKQEMYDQLPVDTYPATVYITPDIPLDEIIQHLDAAGICFPCIAKPDIGMKGIGVRKIKDMAALQGYHTTSPARYLIQNWLDGIEYGVFYYRHPTMKHGSISGLVSKELPYITGDATSTIAALLAAHPFGNIWRKKPPYLLKHRLQEVLPLYERLYVTDTANRSQGARIQNLTHLVTPDLLSYFDQISQYNGAFFYGRYDIKCSALQDLLTGKNIQIIEFNGAGAGPTHIYHSGYSFAQVFSIMAKQWQALYEISRHNHTVNHIAYWSFWKGWLFMRQSRRAFSRLLRHAF